MSIFISYILIIIFFHLEQNGRRFARHENKADNQQNNL
ncbi:hypothetical protein SC1083_2046 [Aggregatibacter actinomycetemcomitans serotype e str. SC1083]|uniref:Uncharacterized protein n=1 Tax=Aggregatibacter actinomycetemcomitans serotype e str. SC1083 TaxID=907488 RepID=G4AB16_AGGAC|nr:hypothetical protein SC1083_2046 [Aggregatibacter actinomycetemcomitans serotype e str. SC1083]